MNLNPLKFLYKRISFTSAVLLPVLIAYLAITFVIFYKAVIPSYADGTTSWTFAVDSTIYTDYADSLRAGRNDPLVLGALAYFPNTLWAPVLIALVLNSALLVMLLNYTLFVFSIWILKRGFGISAIALITLLLLNPTTTTSLLCVNKEVLDLLAISIFLYSQRKCNNWLLLIAMGLALFNRYEICIVMLVFKIAQSRLNPWREKRFVTLLLLVGSLNFAMPIWGARELARRFDEAQYAGFIKILDNLQMNYLYVLAVVPKIAENLFGQLVNPLVWQEPNSWLYINFFNNLAYVILILVLIKKRQLKLRNDLVYFGTLGAVIVAQALVIQPRYFYFMYVLLCLQAAHKEAPGRAANLSHNPPLAFADA